MSLDSRFCESLHDIFPVLTIWRGAKRLLFDRQSAGLGQDDVKQPSESCKGKNEARRGRGGIKTNEKAYVCSPPSFPKLFPGYILNSELEIRNCFC